MLFRRNRDASDPPHPVRGSRPLSGPDPRRAGSIDGASRVDGAVAALAARQHLAIARWQLLDLGLSGSAITRRVAGGRLFAVVRGAYSLIPDPPLRTVLVAALICHRGPAVVSHDATLLLAGLLPEPVDVEITVPLVSGRRSTKVVTVHQAALARDEIVRLDDIPSTSVTRAIVDTAARYDEPALTAILDAARIADLLDVEAVAERYAGRPGGPLLREILTDGNAARAERERRAERLLVEAGLPRPERNSRVGRYEYDLVWHEHRFVVELDSRRYHGAGERVERDREKERNLRVHRYGHLRFTHRQIAAKPTVYVAEVSAELAMRAA